VDSWFPTKAGGVHKQMLGVGVMADPCSQAASLYSMRPNGSMSQTTFFSDGGAWDAGFSSSRQVSLDYSGVSSSIREEVV
jgi:hypothetical protein